MAAGLLTAGLVAASPGAWAGSESVDPHQDSHSSSRPASAAVPAALPEEVAQHPVPEVGETGTPSGGLTEIPSTQNSLAHPTTSSSPTNDLLLRRLFEMQSGPEEDQQFRVLQEQLSLARQQRRSGDLAQATVNLIALFRSGAPEEIRCPALFELALVAQDDGLPLRAQQILSQYIHLFPNQPGVIEAYLRQGLLLRQIGASELAISKFYAVMSGALNLRLDQLEYYQRLVLQAQIEIADTYYQEGRWSEAADYLKRVLKLDSKFLDRAQVQGRLIKALAAQGDSGQAIGQAQVFLEAFPDSPEVPEVRFLLARHLKKQGRRTEALQQVMALLESQQATSAANPLNWAYWQKRVGNEIANELYSEGDYLGALGIFQRLEGLDGAAAWQLPVQYQIGLVFERLSQPAKAAEVYASILRRESEVSGTNSTPGLQAVLDMARWRQGNLGWLQSASASVRAIQNSSPTLNPSPADETPGGNR